MTFQSLIEMVQQVFPTIGYTQIIKELDMAQKVFNNDTETLWIQYSLPNIRTVRTFALPSNFRKLKRVDFLTSTNEVVYGTGLIWDVSYNSITFDSALETMTSIPSAIGKVILNYVYQPTTVSVYTATLEIPEEYYMALFHRVMEGLHSRFPTVTVQLTNGQINQQKDWNAVKYHQGEYKTLRIGAKRDVMSMDNTSFNIVGAGYAGQSVNRVVSILGGITPIVEPSTALQLIFRIENANAVPNPIIIDANTFGADVTFTLIDTGKYRITSNMGIFYDQNRIYINPILRSDTDIYLIKTIKNSSYQLDIELVPFMGGGYADHDVRVEVYGIGVPVVTSLGGAVVVNVGLWADRPFVGAVPGRWMYFATDQNSMFTYNGQEYV